MKIQINNLEALERLIGNDNEIEFEIRQSVVEAFSKKHLRSLANCEFSKAAENTIQAYLSKELLETVKLGNWTTEVRLKGEYAKAFDAAILRRVEEVIKGIVEKAIDASGHKDKLNRLIADRVNYITDQWSIINIERRIDAAVNEKIRKKFGL